MTDFIYSIGDLFNWTFTHIVEPLGNIPNYIFIVAGFVTLGYCIKILKGPETANN